MEIKQNLLVDDLEFFQPEVIINIDEYLPCYDEVSYQSIDNTHQATTASSDVSMTTSHINQANTELDMALKNILPTPIPSNLSMSEYFPIYEDLSDPTPQPTVMSDNTHDSELVATTSTHNNVHPTAHQSHNTIVETENKQKFVTTNNDENNEWDVTTCSHD